jgi:hypothetical protein
LLEGYEMIRRITGIGSHNLKPFISTNRYVRVLKEVSTDKNITEVNDSTKLISNQAEEYKKLVDPSFEKKPISNFFGDSSAETTRENFTENSPVPTNN